MQKVVGSNPTVRSMSSEKKEIRRKFRESVFLRDEHRCQGCGWKVFNQEHQLDAHHITDRNEMPGGGYVVENGISLCPPCHEKAEEYHRTGIACEGFSPDDLYRMVGSSYDLALAASKKLERGLNGRGN